MIKNAIFDIDGTILDTFLGVSKCIKYALKNLNKPIPSDDTLRRFLGPSLMESFSVVCGLSSSEASEAVRLYRSLYKDSGMFECELFDGFPQIFDRLQQKGIILSVASSKPKPYIVRIFDKMDISKYFVRMEGPELDGASSDKKALVAAAQVHESAVMIGDRYFDIQAASELKIMSIGVTYGFCQDGEFDVYKPDFIANNAEEIYDIIINKS